MDQAEKLREIIKKQNQSNESSARIITVTSGKGGVGKSNVSINLALQFRRQGETRHEFSICSDAAAKSDDSELDFSSWILAWNRGGLRAACLQYGQRQSRVLCHYTESLDLSAED